MQKITLKVEYTKVVLFLEITNILLVTLAYLNEISKINKIGKIYQINKMNKIDTICKTLLNVIYDMGEKAKGEDDKYTYGWYFNHCDKERGEEFFIGLKKFCLENRCQNDNHDE